MHSAESEAACGRGLCPKGKRDEWTRCNTFARVLRTPGAHVVHEQQDGEGALGQLGQEIHTDGTVLKLARRVLRHVHQNWLVAFPSHQSTPPSRTQSQRTGLEVGELGS